MTTTEFCEATGLNPRKLTNSIMNGLLETELIDKPHGGFRRELTPEHIERARLLKALVDKRIPFARPGTGHLRRRQAASLPGPRRGDRNGGAGQSGGAPPSI